MAIFSLCVLQTSFLCALGKSASSGVCPFKDTNLILVFARSSLVKNPPASAGDKQVRSLDQEDHLEKEIATCSSILAWKIPWTEECGRLQSMGSQRVRHDWATEHACFIEVESVVKNIFHPGLPWWLSGKESTCQHGRHRFSSWSGKIPHAVEHLISRCSRAWGTTAAETLVPVLRNKRSCHNEKPVHHN